MRLTSFASLAAFASLLAVACGGVATSPSAVESCGTNTCGACPSGFTNQDTCSNGKWACNCKADSGSSQCTAAPTCSKSEGRFADLVACERAGAASCRTQSMCGTSIACGLVTAMCDGRPSCNPGDSEVGGQSDCPPGVSCYSRAACGTTIWCAGDPPHPTPAVVWPASATVLVATDEGGGFVQAPPAGSACMESEVHFTFTRATRALAYQVCDATKIPYAWKKGTRTLTVNEASTIETTMANVALTSSPMSCGADKSVEWLMVTSANGTQKYLDSFYACEKKGVYVDNVDPVLEALRALVP